MYSGLVLRRGARGLASRRCPPCAALPESFERSLRAGASVSALIDNEIRSSAGFTSSTLT